MTNKIQNPNVGADLCVCPKGFTLLELLVAILIFAVIVSAVYGTMYSGIKVWNVGDDKTGFSESSQIALNKMTKDIRNVVRFSGIKFEGEKNSISMPVIKDGICKVSYYLDSGNIMRDIQTYSESLKEQTNERELVSDIQELVFSYCNAEREWKDSWEEDSLPYAVRLSIKSKEDNVLEAITEIPIFDTEITHE